MDISRRDLLKMAGMAAIGTAVGGGINVSEAATITTRNIRLTRQAPVVGSKLVENPVGSAAKVYFMRTISTENLIRLYNLINGEIYGRVGIKLHTGEPHGPNILPRDMVQAFQAQVPNSNIVECNTLYAGARYTTAGHRETLRTNGWTFCPVDIMDEDGDFVLPVRNGIHLQEVAMGQNMAYYDSMIVLTHFKGHAMGGFGGSLKNIAIGCASGQVGKKQVHGYTGDEMPPPGPVWFDGTMPLKEEFMERMADSGKATCDFFGKHIVFLNVMRRMSVDCDCAGTSAAEPTIPDIGICASTDILAIDQACCDLVYNSTSNRDLVERMESRAGLHQLTAMANLKMGNPQYELVEII